MHLTEMETNPPKTTCVPKRRNNNDNVCTYLLHCSLYTQARDYTIQTLPSDNITIPVLLSGDPNLPTATNSAIFLSVYEFIIRTNRFSVLN